MQAQQINIDTIANNIANVNTTGFKQGRAEFQDLLYQNIRPAGTASSWLCTKNTSWALIERPYSCAPQAVGPVYDRPGFFVQSAGCGRLAVYNRLVQVLTVVCDTARR